jgi:hypothetical protein
LNWREHGKENFKATPMDQRRHSRAEIERSSENTGAKDCTLAQAHRGRHPTESFQPGYFPGLASIENPLAAIEPKS